VPSLDIEHQLIGVSLGRQRVASAGGVLDPGQAVGGAGSQARTHVDFGDDGGAVLVEQCIAAGVIAVEVGVDQVLDRQLGDLLDRALILSCSGANSESTMRTASLPTATVMLPPSPSSI